jgi:hypothetical protein
MPNTNGIPIEMASIRQWTLWRRHLVDDRWTKLPIQSSGKKAAKSDDPATFASFSEIVLFLAAREKGSHAGRYGLMFIVRRDDPFCVIDLDKVRDKETGAIADWAMELVHRFDTMTQISSSGTGLHLIFRGVKPGPRCRSKDKPGFEVYDWGRPLAMTGNLLPGLPLSPQHRQSELDTLYKETFPDKETDDSSFNPATFSPSDLPDDEIIDRARNARNGAKFENLYRGDWSGYESRSLADEALAGMLAFWCGPDSDRIIKLMRESGLKREKWDRPDYLNRTVESVLSGRTVYYSGRFPQTQTPVASTALLPSVSDSAEEAKRAEAEPLQIPILEIPRAFSPRGCPRRHAALLRYRENAFVMRTMCFACGGWGCTVCRQRNAVGVARNLYDHVGKAVQDGWTVHQISETEGEENHRKFAHRLGSWLRGQGARYRWVETGTTPGVSWLWVFALPPGIEPPKESEPVGIDRFALFLNSWVDTVRTGPRPLGNSRPHVTGGSKEWGNKQQVSGAWDYLHPILSREPETVVRILEDHGIGLWFAVEANGFTGKSFAGGIEFAIPPNWTEGQQQALQADLTNTNDPIPIEEDLPD